MNINDPAKNGPKAVTQERILKAFLTVKSWKKSQEWTARMHNASFNELVSTIAKKQRWGIDPTPEVQRMWLEYNLRGPDAYDDNKALIEAIDKRRRPMHYRLHAIQKRAGVSGLVRGSYSLGDHEYPCWKPHPSLLLLDSDLELLAMERDAIYRNWLEYCVKRSLQFWDIDRWEIVAPADITDAVSSSTFADIYDDSSEGFQHVFIDLDGPDVNGKASRQFRGVTAGQEPVMLA